MQSIFNAYDAIRISVSLDATRIETAALHYLTSECQGEEVRRLGVGDIITQWILSQVQFFEGKAYIDSGNYGHARVKILRDDTSRGDDSILSYLDECYLNGLAPVLDTAVTGGTPLWSDWVNNLFRAVHDLHHYRHQLSDDVKSEVVLGYLTSEECYDWLVFQGHDRQLANKAGKALFFEIAGQAVAATWLGGYDGKRRNPYTGEIMSFSQKVITTGYYDSSTLHGGKS